MIKIKKIMLKLELETDVNYFATSDLHIGHKNVINFCDRPFVNTKEMHDKLIENYNSVVKENDVVFFLGDIVWSDSRTEFRRFMNKLNGIKKFIPGNHDRKKILDSLPSDLPKNFEILSDIVHLHKNNVPLFVLSHYPLVTWAGIERGCINLHGHIHSGPFSKKGFDTSFKTDKHLDIGVDNQNFTPYLFHKAI